MPSKDSDLVVVKDLLNGAFVFTCHKTELATFHKALRQQQITLTRLSVPAGVVSAIDITKPLDSADDVVFESLAMCYYAYLTSIIRDEKSFSKLFTVEKKDMEDNWSKAVSFYRAVAPVCFGSLMIRAVVTNGKTPHVVCAIYPASHMRTIHEKICAKGDGKSKKLLSTSHKKVATVPDATGDWSIAVESTPNPEVASAILDFKMIIKVRSEVAPLEATCSARLPPAKDDGSDSDSDADDDLACACEFSEMKVIGGSADPVPLPRDPASYKLPLAEKEGPEISGVDPTKDLKPHTVEVINSKDAMKLTPMSMRASQDFSARDGVFTQYVTMALNLVNSTTDMISLRMEPVVECSDLKGQPCKASQTRLGSQWEGGRHGEINAEFKEGNLDIPAKESVVVAVLANFVIEGKPGRDNQERARLHGSFAQPATFTLTLVEDHSGEQHKATFHYADAPPDLDDEATMMKAWHTENFEAFVFADDVVAKKRHAAGVFVSETDGFVIARRGQQLFFSLQTLNNQAFQAAKKGAIEIPLTNISNDNFKFTLLVSNDEYPPIVYGIRIEAITETSRAVGYAHVKLPGSGWIRPKDATPSSAASTASMLCQPSFPTSSWASSCGTATSSATHVSVDASSSRSAASASTGATMGERQLSAADTPYTIMYDQPLGSGAFGAVFKGFDSATGKTVAVKEARVDSNKSQQASLRSEFHVLTALSHPNVLRVHALTVDEHVLRVFMEWMPSGSISSLLQAHPRLHEGVIRRYLRDALKGLAYLHSQSILHLDLKPANMLVTSDGDVKLADFGTTKLLAAGSTSLSTNNIVGTPAYMAPEIITGRKYFKGSDIWSVGCCIAEMASGQMPWGHLDRDIASSAISLIFHVGSAKPPEHHPRLPSHVSGALKAIAERCFSPNVALRPTAAELLQDPYFTAEVLPFDAESIAVYREAEEAEMAARTAWEAAVDTKTVLCETQE